MKTVLLNIIEDLATGELGLVVDGMKIIDTPMAANEGLLIAHDLLEHQNGIQSIGSIDDELEALGGLWYVRGMTGILSKTASGSMYSAHENVGTDIDNLGRLFLDGIKFKTKVPSTYTHTYDDDFSKIIRHGCVELLEEFPLSAVQYYKYAALNYLRRGFNKAKKRYPIQEEANHMFWSIAAAVDPYAKNLDYEGQQLKLTYDKHRAYCEDYYPEEFY